MSTLRVTIKIGGHLVSTEERIVDIDYFMAIADVLREVHHQVSKLTIVVGGGTLAREYIKALSKVSIPEGLKDIVGIWAARLNAMTLISILSDIAYSSIPTSIEDYLRALSSSNVVVLGGLQPGQSTTTVAALVAEAGLSDLLILTTDVDGIYTSDPKRDPNAKKLEVVHVDELEKLIVQEYYAGSYALLDSYAIRVLKRSRIRTFVINGRPPNNILRILSGERIGTEIVY
ncbi:MAG: UMP kinase [Thermoprotei archaeon]|nr:MAG: UMP kinase [Thermoprotei archaeon]